MKLALDTSVFVYAVSRDHPMRQPSREFFGVLSRRGIKPDISIQVLLEYTHFRGLASIRRALILEELESIIALSDVHDVSAGIMQGALRLIAGHPKLDIFDAIHAATAMDNQVDAIVSSDVVFDEVEGLHRIDPEEAASALSP